MRHSVLPYIVLLSALFATVAWANQTLAIQLPSLDEGGRVENPPKELKLEYKFENGQSRRYQVQITNIGQFRLLNQKDEVRLNTVTEMYFRQTVLSQNKAASQIEWALLSGVVHIPDYGDSQISMPEMTYEMDVRGVVKKVSGLEKIALLPGKPQQKTLSAMMRHLQPLAFPDRALKQGECWTSDCSVGTPETGLSEAKVTSTLLGYEKCDDYDCAKIETKYDYPVRLTFSDDVYGKLRLDGKESGCIITRFAFKEGKIIRSEGEIKSDATVHKPDGSPSGAYVKLQMNVVSRLLSTKAGVQ